MRTIKLKNNTAENITLLGWTILPNEYLTVDPTEFDSFANDTSVFDKVGAGDVIVNDGTDDLAVIDGWNHITGNSIKIAQTSEIADEKVWVHQSAKPEVDGKKFTTQWIGHGDDPTTGGIAKGQVCLVRTVVEQPTSFVDIELLNVGMDIYLHEGYVCWRNADFGDNFSAYVMAKPTPLQTSVNLDYTIDGEHRIHPAAGGAGTGSHGFAGNPVLVPIFEKTGYWNYDAINGLSYASGANGEYNMYDIEEEVEALMHHIPLLGNSNGFNRFESADVQKLPVDYFLRIKCYNISNTVWELAFIFTAFREKTVNSMLEAV